MSDKIKRFNFDWCTEEQLYQAAIGRLMALHKNDQVIEAIAKRMGEIIFKDKEKSSYFQEVQTLIENDKN